MAHFTPATRRMDGLAGVSMTDLDAVAERTQSAKPDNEAWEALRWLLSRPWFTRVWCVQEIVLARSSRVHVGAFSLDWPKLGVTAAWLSEQSLAFDYDIPVELEGLAWDNAYGMFDTSELSESSLLEVLVEFRDFNATDPRDKVYGLLGLVNAGELEGFPIVDYNKSVAEVYADVVKTSIAKTGHLGSLAYVKHGAVHEKSDFPSWVPRWDVSEDVCSIFHSLSLSAWVDGNKHGLPELRDFCPSDGKVALSGVRFDTIAWMTEAMDIGHFKESQSPESASRHPFIGIWNRSSSNRHYPLDPPDECSISAVLEMATTLTTGFNDGYEMVVALETEDQQQFYTDFLTYIHQLFDYAERKPDTFDPLEVALCQGDAAKFRIAASRSCDQRRVFETAGGFYGLGPACAAEGDVVVMLYGSPIPFVLRQLDGDWILLGDCFVGPLMPESKNDGIRSRFGEEETFVLV
ncbi:hypothetical protein CTRI78_v005628 [Colletotrichum trifolii]|uniref:Heterokaryon incompatibility domain-containing protein n=1 Tax=Colletotrichum trifolii TaxID=5466 RepID=A0A4V3HWH8_COLTR|nr:hypothetical protein CTRI78_v005628 [Colletotrichum trifolii]